MKSTPDGDRSESAAIVRALIAEAASGALATLGADGAPFATLVALAAAEDGAPMLLLSRRAVHTQNLARDPRASLMIAEAAGESDLLARARVSLRGTVVPSEKSATARSLFLARHPDAASYVDFADFGFHRFEMARAHLVAGFGRVADLASAEILRATR